MNTIEIISESEQQQKVDNFFKNIIKRKDNELAQLIVDYASLNPYRVAETIGKETVLLAIDILEAKLLRKYEKAKGIELKIIKDELIELNALKKLI